MLKPESSPSVCPAWITVPSAVLNSPAFVVWSYKPTTSLRCTVPSSPRAIVNDVEIAFRVAIALSLGLHQLCGQSILLLRIMTRMHLVGPQESYGMML